MRPPHLLLLDALLEEPAKADAASLPRCPSIVAWRRWREAANIDQLDSQSFAMLPALAGRIEGWLSGDPFRDKLIGICRRGWSQTQLRKRQWNEAAEVLRAAGVSDLAPAGPIAWSDLYWPAGSVRTISTLDFRVTFESMPRAVACLTEAGYRPLTPISAWSKASSYFAPPLQLQTPSGPVLRLHWRALPNDDFSLRRPSIVDDERYRREHDLLRVLGGDYADEIDWLCDAAIICRPAAPAAFNKAASATGSNDDLDWDEIERLLRWRSRCRVRIAGLAAEYPAIPAHIARGSGVRIGDLLLTSPLRAYRRTKAAILGQ